MANDYDFSMDYQGLDELERDMERAMKLFPDECRRNLEEQGNEFRTMARQEYRKATTRRTGNLTRGFYISPVMGLGLNQFIEFCAEGNGRRRPNPHFHLIENGHKIVLPYSWDNVGGDQRGFVPGVKLIPKLRAKFEPVFRAAAERTIDKILKGSGLT
jgi:hypothetical protein